MSTDKKKLLVIINRFVIGGQAIDTIPLLHRLKGDFDILVLYGCREKDEIEAQLLFDKFKGIHYQPMRYFKRSLNPVKDIRSLFTIIKTIHAFRPAIVHTHGMKSGLFGRIGAWFCRVPCIIHTFHGHHFHSYFNKFLSQSLVFVERLMARVTYKIVAISPLQKQELCKAYKIAAPEKFEIIPLGIDDTLFGGDEQGKRNAFREKYRLATGDVAVGIVGRIVAIKNLDMFVRVVAGVLGTGVKAVKFFIIGDGEEKIKVQQSLSNLGISWTGEDKLDYDVNVIFTSWVPEIAHIMHGLDIVVLTSYNEGTPMSLIEAQYCGKPVIATNVGGVKDTFEDGESGFLIPPGNDDLFIQKLALLTGNQQLRNEMGERGAIFARKNFSKEKEINSFKTLYLSCNT